VKINQAGLDLIKSFEQCRLTAYADPGTGGEPYTIGWGHTGHGIYLGMQISQEQADLWLASDVAKFEECVDQVIMTPVTDNQFSACVSLAYNIGVRNFSGSTLVKKHKAGDFNGAAGEFVRWNKAAGKVMLGLRRRRAAEQALFRGMNGDQAIAMGAAVN